MNKALRWFIQLWIGIFILVNLAAIAGTFLHDGFWGCLSRLQDIYSPFNIFNWIMEVLLLSPALLAARWLDRRKHSAAP